MAASPKHDEVPLAVWPVAQTMVRQQGSGCDPASSTAPPDTMAPALARRIIETYSAPGELVVDPLCRVGTTLVEGATLGRRLIGVESQPRCMAQARATLEHALSPEQRELAEVRVGDARRLAEILTDVAGTVDLILAKPLHPGPTGQPAQSDGAGFCDQATPDDAAGVAGRAYEVEMAAVFAACHLVLRPGGILVAVTRNLRRQERCLDLAEATVRLARLAGFVYVQHVVALLCAVRDGELVALPSPQDLAETSKARAAEGLPVHLVAHENVLVFRKEGDRD